MRGVCPAVRSSSTMVMGTTCLSAGKKPTGRTGVCQGGTGKQKERKTGEV